MSNQRSMSVTHEWGRFIWWLNANSGAFQAAASVVTAVVTLYLVKFNRRAVHAAEAAQKAAHDQFNLGQRQFVLAQEQFALAVQPKLVVTLNYDPSRWHAASYTLRNVGTETVQIVDVFIQLGWPHRQGLAYIPIKLSGEGSYILAPDEENENQAEFNAEGIAAIDKYGSNHRSDPPGNSIRQLHGLS